MGGNTNVSIVLADRDAIKETKINFLLYSIFARIICLGNLHTKRNARSWMQFMG